VESTFSHSLKFNHQTKRSQIPLLCTSGRVLWSWSSSYWKVQNFLQEKRERVSTSSTEKASCQLGFWWTVVHVLRWDWTLILLHPYSDSEIDSHLLTGQTIPEPSPTVSKSLWSWECLQEGLSYLTGVLHSFGYGQQQRDISTLCSCLFTKDNKLQFGQALHRCITVVSKPKRTITFWSWTFLKWIFGQPTFDNHMGG
jgi:hypothetical protein